MGHPGRGPLPWPLARCRPAPFPGLPTPPPAFGTPESHVLEAGARVRVPPRRTGPGRLRRSRTSHPRTPRGPPRPPAHRVRPPPIRRHRPYCPSPHRSPHRSVPKLQGAMQERRSSPGEPKEGLFDPERSTRQSGAHRRKGTSSCRAHQRRDPIIWILLPGSDAGGTTPGKAAPCHTRMARRNAACSVSTPSWWTSSL